jgi:hypothetical protein
LREAQVVIESWRRHDNAVRLHAALGYQSPAPEVFVPAFAARPATLPLALRPTLHNVQPEPPRGADQYECRFTFLQPLLKRGFGITTISGCLDMAPHHLNLELIMVALLILFMVETLRYDNLHSALDCRGKDMRTAR